MTYYAVTIRYTDTENQTHLFTKKNMTAKEFFNFREMIYSVGLFVPDKDCPGTEGAIISPYCIGNIDVCMQEKKFEK